MLSSQIQTIDFCQINRQDHLQYLKDTIWDILIIGGGINGAGVALEAAYRGLKVAVLEQKDFAFGTSSRSTKLAHGGFRYIGQKEFGLVREATTERNWLREKGLPHLTRPTRFLYPIFSAGKVNNQELEKSWGYWTVRLGAFLYDLLSGFGSYKRGKGIKDVEKIKALEPFLETSRLKGAITWFDSNIDDARLVIETLKEAVWTKNTLPMNYIRVVGFSHDSEGLINGVEAIDINDPNAAKFRVQGKVVVNTTGVWADEVLRLNDETKESVIRPTKGVHITYHRKDFPINDTIAVNSIDDGRFFFAIRRNEWVLVGTTDTDYSGDPAKIYCTREDADYLRNTLGILFPKAKIDDKHIHGTFAGLRPLVAETGKAESDVSRKHTVLKRDDGLYSLLGGKLTSFRKMAEDLVVNHIRKVQAVHDLPKFSGKKNLTKIAYAITLSEKEWESLTEVTNSKLPPVILRHLYQQYGRGGITILGEVEKHPERGNRLLDVPEYPIEVAPWIEAEVDYVVRHEAPLHLEDVLCRRMEISWLIRPEFQGKIAKRAANRMAAILGWAAKTKEAEIARYLENIRKNSFFFEGEISVPL
ncbi:MAG: glycerol-3-phosphate dehydrogenase/oxidase [Candidatus Thorarchaeota archaeon]